MSFVASSKKQEGHHPQTHQDACMSGLFGSDHSLDTIQDIKRRNAFRLVYYKNTIHSGYTQMS